jgi:hypothetical protein
MNYTNLALSILVVAVIWHVTATMMIHEALRKRSLKVSFILLRLLAPKCASQYREITRKATGKPGRYSITGLSRSTRHWLQRFCSFWTRSAGGIHEVEPNMGAGYSNQNYFEKVNQLNQRTWIAWICS